MKEAMIGGKNTTLACMSYIWRTAPVEGHTDRFQGDTISKESPLDAHVSASGSSVTVISVSRGVAAAARDRATLRLPCHIDV